MSNFIVFLGAGASATAGIPTMSQMVEEFEVDLRNRLSPLLSLYDGIKMRLKDYLNFDIEALITVLQDIIEVDQEAQR